MPSDDARNNQLRYLFARAFEASAPMDHCPEATELYDDATGQSQPEQAHRIALHLAECPVCAEGWRIARVTGDHDV